MATLPPSPSTLVDSDPAPDVPTASRQMGQHIVQHSRRPQLPSTSIFYSIPTQHHKTPQGSNVHFASMRPADSLLVQGQSGEQGQDPMQLCILSPETQHDLLGYLPSLPP